MGDFADSVRRFAKVAKEDTDKAVKEIEINLFNSVITLSPLGRPELWKRPAPKGYVGGRFRGAWTTTVGEPGTSPERIDPSGMLAMAEVHANVGGAGKITFLCNTLPYAHRLEYDGWSSQAEAGMVRISVAKFGEIVEAAGK